MEIKLSTFALKNNEYWILTLSENQWQKLSNAKYETLNQWLAQLFMQMFKIFFLYFQEYFSIRITTLKSFKRITCS